MVRGEIKYFFLMQGADERSSRIDKLKSIPPGHLLLMARGWLFGHNNNKSVAHVTNVLEAAARGSEESDWLLDKLRSKGEIPKFHANWHENWSWLAEIMSTEDSPRAKYYRGVSLWMIGYSGYDWMEPMRQSAEAGFAPAMSWLGDKDDDNKWLCKAVELKDPDGLYQLAYDGDKREFELLCEAAARGNTDSMYLLARNFPDRLSPVEAATFEARRILYDGFGHDKASLKDLDVVYVTGRELEGYERFWDKRNYLDNSYLHCIDVYLTVMHRARQAALQTVTGLRRFVGRDVARLIGKMVYNTRQSDSYVWWWHTSTAKKRKTF